MTNDIIDIREEGDKLIVTLSLKSELTLSKDRVRQLQLEGKYPLTVFIENIRGKFIERMQREMLDWVIPKMFGELLDKLSGEKKKRKQRHVIIMDKYDAVSNTNSVMLLLDVTETPDAFIMNSDGTRVEKKWCMYWVYTSEKRARERYAKLQEELLTDELRMARKVRDGIMSRRSKALDKMRMAYDRRKDRDETAQ